MGRYNIIDYAIKGEFGIITKSPFYFAQIHHTKESITPKQIKVRKQFLLGAFKK